MTTFAERLKNAMEQTNVSQSDLSRRTGASKAAISQYLSGKNTPGPDRIKALADATGVSFDYLMGYGAAPVAEPPIKKISVKEAARCMGKSDQFVRIGLQRGLLPFGNAVPGTGACWNYYINPTKFRDYVGADQFNSFFGLKTVAQEGKVTAEVVKNAMFAMADETNAKFDSMPKTWAQIWVDMKNQALSMFAPILTKINQIGNSTKFQKVTTGLINGLAAVANVASSALDILIAIASVFVDNWGIIQPLVLGIAAAMLLYNGYLIANNAITAISNAQKGLAAVQAYKAAVANTTLAATEKAEAMAKASATAAQYGFNAALLACPLTWILLIIIAVIAAIYMIVAAINKLTGSTISATGIICGVVAVAGAFVLNCAIGVLNAIIQAIWTIFVAPFLGIVEWILNVCNGGFNSFGDAVANLIGQIIGWFLNLGKVVTTIIDAIFGTDWTSGLESLQSAVTSWGKNENAITLDKNAPTIDYRATYSGAWDAGYDFGQGIDDKIGGMFDASGLDSMGAFDLSNTLDGIYGNTGDTAANTAATADALDIAEEDLAYLRDIAEREAINRFTTAEIKVEQHNENHISKDADLDGIMDAWANDFAEKLEVSEEGVHE